jgi:hypothetical protein
MTFGICRSSGCWLKRSHHSDFSLQSKSLAKKSRQDLGRMAQWGRETNSLEEKTGRMRDACWVKVRKT